MEFKKEIDRRLTEFENLAIEVEDLKAILEKKEKELRIISHETLPELLDECGIKSGTVLNLEDGRKVKVKDYFYANIPAKTTIEKCKDVFEKIELEERKEKAMKWLKENQLEDVIKDEFKIDGQKNKTLKSKLNDFLVSNNFFFSNEESVNAMTLKSVLKEQIAKGVDVPLEVFNVETGLEVELD
jgi:hypothetical protein